MLENKCKNIPVIIREHMDLFAAFEEVYLFGSTLDPDVIQNDVDLLVIYKEFRDEINRDVNEILYKLQETCEMPIDLTALSITEQKNTDFLKKLGSHYLKIK